MSKILDNILNAFSSNPAQEINIIWSTPRKISSILKTDAVFDWGIYQITTTIQETEHLLYIGKTWHNFNSRLKKHQKWLKSDKGYKYVRFGYIQTAINERQLDEVESAIIYQLSPPRNVLSRKSYTTEQEYRIYSTGDTGFVPDVIKTKKH